MPSLLDELLPWWKYRVLVATAAGLLVLAGGWAYVHHQGYAAAEAAIEHKTKDTAIAIREAQNEARNHRPDNDAVLKLLRTGNF